MRADPEAVVDGFYQAFAVDDFDAQMTYFAEDALFMQRVPEAAMAYAGIELNKEQMTARLAYLYAHWDKLEMRPLILRVDGSQVTCQMDFVFRHKATGTRYEGQFRHIFQIADGRIVRLDEYADPNLMRACMELIAQEQARLGATDLDEVR